MMIVGFVSTDLAGGGGGGGVLKHCNVLSCQGCVGFVGSAIVD